MCLCHNEFSFYILLLVGDSPKGSQSLAGGRVVNDVTCVVTLFPPVVCSIPTQIVQ